MFLSSKINIFSLCVCVCVCSLVPPLTFRSKGWTPVPGVENYVGKKKVGHLKVRGGTQLHKHGEDFTIES